MQKIGDIAKKRINIILEGFDPLTANGFIQLPKSILKNKTLSSGAKVCYGMLLNYAWYVNRVFPGQEKLAEEMGTSVRSVSYYLAELQKSKHLSVKRRGLGKTNIYILYARIKTKKDRT